MARVRRITHVFRWPSPERLLKCSCVPALADAAGAVAAVCFPAHEGAVVAAVEVSVAFHVCAGAARTERQT